MKGLVFSMCLSIVIPIVLVYWWMSSACEERGEMEHFKITKVVGTKCYGSNGGVYWSRIFY